MKDGRSNWRRRFCSQRIRSRLQRSHRVPIPAATGKPPAASAASAYREQPNGTTSLRWPSARNDDDGKQGRSGALLAPPGDQRRRWLLAARRSPLRANGRRACGPGVVFRDRQQRRRCRRRAIGPADDDFAWRVDEGLEGEPCLGHRHGSFAKQQSVGSRSRSATRLFAIELFAKPIRCHLVAAEPQTNELLPRGALPVVLCAGCC